MRLWERKKLTKTRMHWAAWDQEAEPGKGDRLTFKYAKNTKTKNKNGMWCSQKHNNKVLTATF